LDGNCVEQLQIMDNAKLAATLMKGGEPVGLVGQVQLFVDSSSDLFVNDVENGVVDSWWYRHVSKDPGDVFGDRHANRWEEVFVEGAFLCLVPGESVLVNHHEMVHESLFLGSEKAMRVVLLDDVEAGLVIVTSWQEVNRKGRSDRKVH
jgi:hypothetical protein